MLKTMNIGISGKNKNYDTDVIVIGGGASGIIAAQTLASANKKIILIEQHKLGGNIASKSTIPTRALLETVSSYKIAQSSLKFGVDNKPNINIKSALHWQQRAINATGVNNINIDKLKNITIVKGHGHFIDKNTVSVGLNRYKAKNIIVATGSSYDNPLIDGAENIKYYTPENLYNSIKLPESITIIGGGPRAYEQAQILLAFKVKVHILEKHKHILPKLDQEAGDMAQYTLEQNGAHIKTLANVVSVSMLQNKVLVKYTINNTTHNHKTEAILFCDNKKPNIDIGLVNAKITVNKYGVVVNNKFQTSQKHIYAVGSATKSINSDNGAILSGQIAAHNILHRKKVLYQANIIPKVCYGIPEIAHVGSTEQQARLTGLAYQTAISPIDIVGRSMTGDYSNGFVKIIASHYGTVIGATIVSPNASEIINELVLAIKYKHKACDVANTPHVFSSWSEAIRVAASNIKCI